MLVFAYGSLLWNPGFPVKRATPAFAAGWKRSWCVESRHHRGTPDRPGMVLGLVPGDGCVGMALEPDQDGAATLAYLDARELAEPGYSRTMIPVTLECGRTERAWTYVADRSGNPCSRLFRARLDARGVSGSASEYVSKAMSAISGIKVPEGWPPPCPALPCDGSTLRMASGAHAR